MKIRQGLRRKVDNKKVGIKGGNVTKRDETREKNRPVWRS